MKGQILNLKLCFLFLLCLTGQIVHAENTGPCAIETMTIEFLECNSDGTYDVEIYYTILNPVGDTLSLFINSEHHADYIIGGSLTVENVEPSDVFDTDIFFLCMKEDEDCYHSLDFAQPECLCVGPCEVEDIQVLILGCDEDENTYTAQVFYTINNPGHDVVHVTINNQYFGSFPVGETIIIDGITPRPNTDYDIIQICATDECCGIFEYMQEDCENEDEECDISNIEIIDYFCTDSGTYAALWIDYDVANPPDSLIHLVVNNEYVGGWIVGEIISFDVGQIQDDISITLFFDGTDCTETLEISNICGDDCGWGDIELNGFECLDEEYFVTLNYLVINPPFEEVYLSLNGAGMGGHPVNEPIQIGDLITPTIEVFLYFYSEETDTICGITQFFDNPCATSCNLGCLQGQFEWEYECEENANAFSIEIQPFLECGPDSIDLLVTVNNEITLPYNSAELWIFDVVPNQVDTMTLSICYEDDPDCCLTYALPHPDCGNALPCAIDSAMVYLNCVEDNFYYLEGFALVTNPDNDLVDVYVDDIFIDNYEISQNGYVDIYSEFDTLLQLQPNNLYDITICVNDNPDCCTTVTAVTEFCPNSCSCLEESTYEIIDVDCQANGEYTVVIQYDFPCDSIDMHINAGPIIQLNGSGTFTFTDIPPSDIPLINMCLGSEPNCCWSTEWDQPQCFNNDEPVEDLFSIAVNNSEIIVETEEESSLGLMDLGGRLVRTHGNKGKVHRMGTTGIPTGVYIVNIIEATQIRSKKVFISN